MKYMKRLFLASMVMLLTNIAFGNDCHCPQGQYSNPILKCYGDVEYRHCNLVCSLCSTSSQPAHNEYYRY